MLLHIHRACYTIYTMKFSIRLLYLYLFSAIGLLIFVIGCIRLIDLAMKIYVFNNADLYTYTAPVVAPLAPGDKGSGLTQEQIDQQNAEAKRNQEQENRKNRQRETSGALAMMLIGAPLYFYHWRTISRENKNATKKK